MLGIVKNIGFDSYQSDQVKYLTIERWSSKIEQIIGNYDAVLIKTEMSSDFEEIVSVIRTHPDKHTYLMPVFFTQKIKTDFIYHTDGIFLEEETDRIALQILDNLDKISTIPQQSNYQDSVNKKVLSYIYSRKKHLHAIKSRIAKTGYMFPFLDLYFTDEFEKLKLLKKLEQKEVLSSEVKHKVQLCNSCSDSFLMFQETCPKCHSIDIKANDVIHHFSCAHVAPAYKYEVEGSDQLQCPKCHKHLRHIGIDYDKPSVVYTCNTCDNHFQDADMIAECHSCNEKNPLDKLVEATIKNYQLTPKGILYVEEKIINIHKEENNQKNIFQELINTEKNRLKKEGTSSYLGSIKIKGKLLGMLSDHFLQELWNEIMQINTNYIPSHIYQLKTDNTIQLIFVDVTEIEMTERFQKLIRNIEILVHDNVGESIIIHGDYNKIA